MGCWDPLLAMVWERDGLSSSSSSCSGESKVGIYLAAYISYPTKLPAQLVSACLVSVYLSAQLVSSCLVSVYLSMLYIFLGDGTRGRVQGVPAVHYGRKGARRVLMGREG